MIRSSTIVIGVIAAATLAGCSGGGGGWLAGRNGGRATIGLDGGCFGGTATGSITYIDRSVSPEVSVEMTSGTCSGTAAKATLIGSYRPRNGGAWGTAKVILEDTGTAGPTKGDRVSIRLTGGAFSGYRHAGALEGGNLDLP